MGLYHLDDQQLADYQEGRRARLAREAEAALCEIDRLLIELRMYTKRHPENAPPRELAHLCAALAAEGVRFERAREEAGRDGVLGEGP